MVNKIPRKIHYCWFGGKEKPEIVEKCISTWKSNLNGYEFIEWNEKTFDINKNKFVKEAYEAKKYAFVSDYVRVYALYNYGGIYLDTDVEVYKSFDELLDNESFWGYEEKNYIATSTIGAKPKNKLVEELMKSYYKKSFKKLDGTFDIESNVNIITTILKNNGVTLNGKQQTIAGIATIYPQQYFSPYDYINCIDNTTEESYAIHYFYKSWLPYKEKIKTTIKKILVKIFGKKNVYYIRKLKDRL